MNVVVRISNTPVKSSAGTAKITVGTQCGYPMRTGDFKFANIGCSPAISGQYIIVQTLGKEYLALGEISIFTAGLP